MTTDDIITAAILADDWHTLEDFQKADDAATFGEGEALTKDQARRVHFYFHGASVSPAELAPWIAAAIALNSVWHSEHYFRQQTAPAAAYHWAFWRMLTRAPDVINTAGGEVNVGWIVDDLPDKHRGARDIRWLTFNASGYVAAGDTNIIWPGMVGGLDGEFRKQEAARLERANHWTGDFDE